MRPNVLTLLVSATPFNVLGQPSYINAKDNIINWFQDGEKGGAYMRLEDYLLTISRHTKDSANTARPSIRSDQLFDKNFANSNPNLTPATHRDYILMADYLFSFCFYGVLLWDKDKGLLKEAEDDEVSDAQLTAFMQMYQNLTGVDAEACGLLKEGWNLASIKKLHTVGMKLFSKRLDLAAFDLYTNIDQVKVKEELKKIMSKIVSQEPPSSDTDIIVKDLLRSSSGESMQLPDGSTKRVLCGRMTIIRWEPVHMLAWP